MKKIKITSLILVAVMVFSMLPLGMIAAFAEEEDTEAGEIEWVDIDLLEKGTLPDGTSFFTRDMTAAKNLAGLPILDYTVPVTTSYAQAVSGHFTPSTKGWYGAQGFLLSSGAFVNGEMQFAPMLEVEAAFGGDMSEYNADQAKNIRGVTNPNYLAKKTAEKSLTELDFGDWTSVAYLSNDGKTWIKQEISTNLDEDPTWEESPMFQPHGYSYMYIPLSSFRYVGANNSSTLGVDTRIGMPFFEFLSIFEVQTVKLNLEMPANPIEYTMNIQFVYENQTIEYDYETAVTDPLTFKTTLQYLTIGDQSGIKFPNYYTTQTNGTSLLPNGTTEIITENTPVNGNDALVEKGLINLFGHTKDLTNVAGIRFKLDTTALGSDAQLMLRMRFLMTGASMAYNSNTFLSKYTSDNLALTKTYTSGTITLSHLSADSAAYYTGKIGKKTVSGVMYTNGGDYTHTASDGILVPANFVGEVYIPLSSYYIKVDSSYNSQILIPYVSEDGGLDAQSMGFNRVDRIVIASNINGSPEDTTVSYDEIEWVYDSSAVSDGESAPVDPAKAWLEKEITDTTPDEITIDTEDELLTFASLLNSETFEGKTVKLTTNIVLNKGWSAANVNLHDSLTENRPAQAWPVAAGANFAGTFDGQGFSISGIFLKTAGDFVGIFGNVPTGVEATVKNLSILNSYVEGTGQGVGAIFGQVDNETTSIIKDLNYKNATRAVIDNVYLDVIVYGSGCSYKSGLNKDMGVGGFIGGSRADVTITNSVFAGTVYGHIRGVAAFIGATRPYQNDKSVNCYRTTITIKNSISSGDVIAPAEFNNSRSQEGTRASYGFVGGLVGYANGNTETFEITNVLLTGKIVDGVTYFAPEKATDEETGLEYETGVLLPQNNPYIGYLFGGSHSSKQSNRAEDIDFQIWKLTNVKYVANSLVVENNGTVSNEVGKPSDSQVFYVIDPTAPDDAVGVTAKEFNESFASTAESTIPPILFARPNPQMAVTVTFDGDFDLIFTLDASEIVVKDDAVLKFKVNGEELDVPMVDGKYTIKFQNISFAELSKEYSISCKSSKSNIFMNMNLDKDGKALSFKVGGKTSVKKVLADILGIETMNDEVKAYVSDLLRVAEANGADISDVTLVGGMIAPNKDSKIEKVGEVFLDASIDVMLPNLLTLRVATNGNAGTVSATLDGAPVAMTLDGDDLVIVMSVKDVGKMVVLTADKNSWTGTVEAVAASVNDAAAKLTYSYAVSASNLLK